MTDTKFKIRDRLSGQFVYIISVHGDIVTSPNGYDYNTYADAYNYIINAQRNSINTNHYLEVERLIIEEYRLTPYMSIDVSNYENVRVIENPDNKEVVNYVKVILRKCVVDGFMSVPADVVQFILTYDKYQPILSELVPPHMLQSIDDFMSVGIKGCDLDVLGSISLTATVEQLNMYDIDGLIRSRENKISK